MTQNFDSPGLMSRYSEGVFATKVANALKAIRTVLENAKTPVLPAEVSHTYDDKYILVQLLTNTAVASQRLF